MNPKDLARSADMLETELSLLIKEMELFEYKMSNIVNKLSQLISKSELSELLENITINHASMTSATIIRWAKAYNRLCSIGIPIEVIYRAPLSRWNSVIKIVNSENAERISYILRDKGHTKLLKKME